jgi:hypothetical protein
MRTPMRVVIVMLAGSTALLAGCNSSTTSPVVPTGTVSFTAPAGGETFQIGNTVTIAWSCSDCTNIPSGDSMQIYAYDGVNAYAVADNVQMSDNVSWVAGSSLESVDLLARTYQLLAQDVDGYFTAQSRFFQLAGGS